MLWRFSAVTRPMLTASVLLCSDKINEPGPLSASDVRRLFPVCLEERACRMKDRGGAVVDSQLFSKADLTVDHLMKRFPCCPHTEGPMDNLGYI